MDKIKGCMVVLIDQKGEVVVSGSNFSNTAPYGNLQDHQRREAEKMMHRDFLNRYMLPFLMHGFKSEYEMNTFAANVISESEFKVNVIWIGDE